MSSEGNKMVTYLVCVTVLPRIFCESLMVQDGDVCVEIPVR